MIECRLHTDRLYRFDEDVAPSILFEYGMHA